MKEKRVWKRLTAAVLAVVMTAGMVCLPGQALKAEAASKPHMKTANVKWDLKNNQTVTYKTKYAGIGMKSQKAKITGYKVKNSTKKGYKELTFTVKWTIQWKVKPDEVHKIVKQGMKNNAMGGASYIALVDYNTGKALGVNNKQKVTGEQIGTTKYSQGKYYYDDDGCYVWLSNITKKVKVTYPKNYKGLCIGVGGSTALKDTNNNTKFWNGKGTFKKTTYYSSKDKSVAHFMRVTK